MRVNLWESLPTTSMTLLTWWSSTQLATESLRRRQLFPDCINRFAFSRWDSWFGAAGLDHASDFATRLLTVCFTVCVGWRSTFPLSPSFVVVLNVSQLTAASRFLVSLRWCACPSMVLRTSWLLFNYHRHRHAEERSRRVPWASVAPSCH